MNLVDRIIGQESGGDPNARNPRSSAGGAGQFIDSTWLSMLAKHRPDIQGSTADLLALKSDPVLSREMTGAYAADNGAILAKSGLPVTAGTSYLAHFAGPQGAVSLLTADPSTPAAAILGDKAMAANPFLRGKTAGDVAAWANQIMGVERQPVAPQPPVQAPQQIASQRPMQPAQQVGGIQQRQMSSYQDAPIRPADFSLLYDPAYERIRAQLLG